LASEEAASVSLTLLGGEKLIVSDAKGLTLLIGIISICEKRDDILDNCQNESDTFTTNLAFITHI